MNVLNLNAPSTAVADDRSAPPAGPVPDRERAARALAVVALAVTSAVHMPVTIDHLHEVPYLGYAFAALVLLTAAAAGSLLVENRAVVWVGALLLAAGALASYVVSRSVGLPMADDDMNDWANPLGLVAGAAEVVVVVTAIGVLLRRRHR